MTRSHQGFQYSQFCPASVIKWVLDYPWMTEIGMLTWLPTINSARTTFTSQPPPIRNEIVWPMILKDGEVRVPCGPSPCVCPAVTDLLGRFSAPPIHQSPCWLAGCPLLRAVGLSPYVGWLLNTVPVVFQPSIPSSKSNLQNTSGKIEYDVLYFRSSIEAKT